MSRSAMQAFTTENILPILSREAEQIIHTEFPPPATPLKINRTPFKLPLPKFRCGQPRPLILVRRPDATPLSDYSLWRSQLYRSFNAYKRIGLSRDFAGDLREALNERSSLPLNRGLKAARRRRLETQRPVSTVLERTTEAVEVCFEYTYSKPLSRIVEQGSPVYVSARRDCPFHRLAIPLFAWHTQKIEDDNVFLPLQLFSENGELLLRVDEDNDQLTVQDALNENTGFVSFGSQLFKVKFTESRRSLDSSTPCILTPVHTIARKCEACKVHNAEVEVSESLVLPLSPCYLCKTCYNELHPESEEGTHYGFVELLTVPESST